MCVSLSCFSLKSCAELSLLTCYFISQVWDLKDHTITERTISPLDFGLPLNPISTVAGGTPLENAATLDLLLDDKLGPNNAIENFVVLNTAALLVVAGRAENPVEGVEMARRSIAEGRAKEALAKFRKASQENAESVPV